jgi:3-dehydroquinate dehydratase / shikimate dehydrogenase
LWACARWARARIAGSNLHRTLLVETVTGQTMADLRVARDASTRGDMIELRLDGVQDIDVAGALAGRTRPVIVTCRPAWEGGRFDGSEQRRHAILGEALDRGAEYVDVEWRAGFADLIARNPRRVVLSSHDFQRVPDDLDARAAAMRQTGAGTIKVAIPAARLTDALALLPIAAGGDAVVIAMGDAGLPSRLLASRFQSRWTYAGDAVAPGQIPASRMLDEFRFRDVRPTTDIYGVVSNNVTHSMSPVMHNAALRAADLDGVYVPLRAADFDDFLTFADAMTVAGASVTIPFKLDALRAAHKADALTRAVGAANTLRRTAGGWEATNTDVQGFLDPLDAVYQDSLKGARAAVLGAGGAARAVVVALLSRGVDVTIHARRQEQAVEVGASCGARVGEWPPTAGSWELLVNCTPLGGPSARNESPLPHGPFTGRMVYDLTYSDTESPLLRDARAAGCLTLDGLPMLVAQAEQQFEWWTGKKAPSGVMANAIRTRDALRASGPRRHEGTEMPCA